MFNKLDTIFEKCGHGYFFFNKINIIFKLAFVQNVQRI